MELTSIKTIACLVPTDVTDEPSYTSASFKPHKIDTIHHGDDYQLSMDRVDEPQMHTWNFDDCMTLNTVESLNKERAELVDFAIQGYDAACLSLSVCHGSRRTMYDKRKQNLELIFKTLKDKMKASKNAITVQYAYVGITDDTCYDLRKESPRSNEYMIEKGIDSLMKKVDDVNDIWAVAESGSTLPFILTIKLTNESEKTIGRLVLIDLLTPRFSPLMQSVNDKAHYTFLKLCDAVRSITDADYHGHLMTSSFLTYELAKYITGHNKLTIFGYINDVMGNDLHSRETTLCLDFIASLRKMPVRMMSNKLVESTLEYRCLVAQKARVEKYNEKLQKHIGDLKTHTSNLKSIIASLQSEKETMQQKLIANHEIFECQNQSKFEEIENLKLTLKQMHYAEIKELEAEIKNLNYSLDTYKYGIHDMKVENEQTKEDFKEKLIDLQESYQQQLSYSQELYKKKLSDSQESHKQQLSNLQEKNAILEVNLEQSEKSITKMKERIRLLESEGLDGSGKQELETKLKHALEEKKKHEENALKSERDLRKFMHQVPTEMTRVKEEMTANFKAKITAVKTRLRESKADYETRIKQLEDELNKKRGGLKSVQDNSIEVFTPKLRKTDDVALPKKRRIIAQDEDELSDDDDVFETPPPVPPSVKSRKKGKKAKTTSGGVHVEVIESDDEGDKKYKANAKRSTRAITPMYNDKAHLEVSDNEEEPHRDHDKENKVNPTFSPQQTKRKRGRPPTKQKKEVDPPKTEHKEVEGNTDNEQDNDKENKVDPRSSPQSTKRKRVRTPTKQKKEIDSPKPEDKEMEERMDNEEEPNQDNDKEDKVQPPSSPQLTKRKRVRTPTKQKKGIDPPKTEDEEVEEQDVPAASVNNEAVDEDAEMPPTIPDDDFSIDNHKSPPEIPYERVLPDFSIPHIDIAETSQLKNEATSSKPIKPEPPADEDDDAVTRSPVLGATTVKPATASQPPATRSQSSQPGGTQRRKRKLRSATQSQNMTDHLHDASQMSPLSQFIKKSEKFLP